MSNIFDAFDEQPSQQAWVNPFPDAQKKNPDAVAAGLKASRITGVDALLAAEKLPELAHETTQPKWEALARSSPKTAGFLQNPVAAAVAHDDVEGLSFVEYMLRGADNFVARPLAGLPGGIGASGWGLFRWIGESVDSLVGGAQRGAAGAFSSAFLPKARQGQGSPTIESLGGSLSGDNPSGTTKMLQYRSEQARLWLEEHGVAGGQYSGPISAGVASGIQSVAQNMATIPASILLGGGAPTLLSGAKSMSPIMAMTFGQEYERARDAGLSVGRATAFSGVQGGLEGATELIPFSRLMSDVKSSSPIWKIMLNQLLPDAAGEQIATLTQDLNEWANLSDKTLQSYLDERPNAALQTAVASVVGTVLMSGPGAIAARRAYKKGVSAQKAEAYAQFIEQLNKAAAASKVLARDPETFQQFVKAAAEDGPVTDVYIDADVLNQSGLADQVLAASPTAAEQFQEALATGGQVRIPVDEYAARIAPQEYAQQLLDDLRLQPEDMTRREAQEYAQSGAMQELEQAMTRIIGDKAQSDTFTASRDAVKQRVLDNLNALGRFTPQKNELDATLIAARSATRAAQLGITPEQFFNDYLLKVTAEGVGGQVLNQFAGQGALTADLDALKAAQDRVAAGEDAETVRRTTTFR
jgi:hypothetical protein